MKSIKVVVLVYLFSIIAAHVCQADPITDAIKELQKAYPKFSWQKDTAVVVDINADGINDIAVLGHSGDKAAVGFVSGSPSKSLNTKILDFNRGRDTQRGMCSKTAKLIVEKTFESPKRPWRNFRRDIGFVISALRYLLRMDYVTQ